MVANTAPILPAGYLSFAEAIDRVGKSLFYEKWTDKERSAPSDASALIAPSLKRHNAAFHRFARNEIDRPPSKFIVPELPPAVLEALRRHNDAIRHLRELCAYGKVVSALLRDDFIVRVGIPSKNWLDETKWRDVQKSHRTEIHEVKSPVPVSGWVMIDGASLAAALLKKQAVNNSSGSEPNCLAWLERLAQPDEGREIARLGKNKWKTRAKEKSQFHGLSNRALERIWTDAAKKYPALARPGRRSAS